MIIKTQSALEALCKELAAHPFITVDTEFLREKTYYSTLCLIQLGDPEGNAAAVDPLDDSLDLTPVFDLLFNPDVLKVFHAGRQDLEIFYQLTGKVVTPFFDTQIAAMVCGYGDSVGYNTLVHDITGHKLDKSTQFTDWSNRPLSDKQLTYALNDVIYLVDIYTHLYAKLEKQNRTTWVFQEEDILNDPATYDTKPEEAWQRIKIKTPSSKTLAILRELGAWRELTAQEKNIPRTWVLRDETLADMAAQAPQTPKALSKIRNFPKNLETKRTGEVLLDLIQKALKSNPKTWPKPKKRTTLSASAAATIDVLKLLLKVQAAQHDVAPKLVADKEDLQTIALEDQPDCRALKGWRYEVFGKDALDMKEGRLALGLKGSDIVKYEISNTVKTR